MDIAYNAAQAKKMLAEGDYDVMTLDIGLPDQNGIELINELRANETTKELPVVVVSVTPSEEHNDQFNALAFRIVDWLTKPIEKEVLHQTINNVIAAIDNKDKRILHVESDDDILHIVKELVGDVAKLDQVRRLHEAKMLIMQTHYDLVILDVNLANDSFGLDLLPILENTSPPIPVLIFSAEESEIKNLKTPNSVLIKSRTHNSQLLETIKRLIGSE